MISRSGPRAFLLLSACLLNSAFAVEYEVGPGKTLATPGAVPWEKLAPGDVVAISWRAEPYRDKFVLCVRGTAEQPITVRGVAGPNGDLPVLDGRDAITPRTLDYWGGERSLIKIGGAAKPADTTPAYLIVENLDLRSARPPFAFTGRKGAQKYTQTSAAMYIEKGEHLTIRNCRLHDCGNGLFVSHATRDVVIDGCHIFENGVENSQYEHNSYTEALGIVFQNNRFGPLRVSCPGNNLKDRSAGLVIRNNWIEGGNRAIDLVDAEDSAELRAAPAYRDSYVYGNVLVKLDGSPNPQLIHYGGDSSKTDGYRKGTLHFFHNTVVARRTSSTVLFGLSTNDERVDARNNIFWDQAGGSKLAIIDGPGQVVLSRNWVSHGWAPSRYFRSALVSGGETSITGDAPGFADEPHDDFLLAPGSACRGAAAVLPPDLAGAHPVRNTSDLGASLSPKSVPPLPGSPRQ